MKIRGMSNDPSPFSPRLIEPSRHDGDPSWLPPCPLGLPQEARPCLGYYEREPGRLQIRFAAYDDEGRCDVVVEERRFCVVVRLVVCRGPEHMGYRGLAEERDHVYLDAPLGGRVVFDFETDAEMPFCVPTWYDNRQTKAPGFYTDEEQARAAWEFLPEGAECGSSRHGARWPLRTLGY